MKHNKQQQAVPFSRRRFLACLPLLALGSASWAAGETAPPLTEENINPTPSSLSLAGCPLNSGGPSLLDTKWRLVSVYGNRVPHGLDITVKVGNNNLAGYGGCNNYSTNFKRVGYTGFRVINTQRTRRACEVMSTGRGRPTINVGDWEGNYLRTLQRMGSVRQDNNILRFFNRNGEIGLVWQRDFRQEGGA